MKMLLSGVVVPELGQVILRPGRDKLGMFRQPIVVSPAPSTMKDRPSGVLHTEQPLINDKWMGFLTHERVLNATGGKNALVAWLKQGVGCQWEGDYHHEQSVILETEQGAIRLCWHHDNELRENPDVLRGHVARNIAEYVVRSACYWFFFPETHLLTEPEICWWSVLHNVSDLLPRDALHVTLRMPVVTEAHGPQRECDITWEVHTPANEIIDSKVEKIKPILKLAIDNEPAAGFMLRPKLKRWECEKWTRWVKTQKCCGCGNPSDDPHHIIGHGQGGMGTKAHDFFVIPVCRHCHDAIHKDRNAWEEEHGSQVELLFHFLDWALGIGAIVIERKVA
ncbi:DUF968 domain-containing protein [Candidatus Symbiopectobacterium sp. NZEC127]|uniref:DUF968 domain-containing protein n=1 Tax=Candidatus Symbiopectobacterium sp. NZEC127 TaxID=2820472 RepID=UPI00222785C4|nr:DUF968 domain-containing protein [Candidatus Symbiopectobacterium sp. NZEC127]MCW2485954.1 DUF968 domain-containing protein [Candidatus Symbiopectobacterium sp. NZEC127]